MFVSDVLDTKVDLNMLSSLQLQCNMHELKFIHIVDEFKKKFKSIYSSKKNIEKMSLFTLILKFPSFTKTTHIQFDLFFRSTIKGTFYHTILYTQIYRLEEHLKNNLKIY